MYNFCFRKSSKHISWHLTSILGGGWLGYIQVLWSNVHGCSCEKHYCCGNAEFEKVHKGRTSFHVWVCSITSLWRSRHHCLRVTTIRCKTSKSQNNFQPQKKTEINSPAHAASMPKQEGYGANLSCKLESFINWRWAMGILWLVIHSLQEKAPRYGFA